MAGSSLPQPHPAANTAELTTLLEKNHIPGPRGF